MLIGVRYFVLSTQLSRPPPAGVGDVVTVVVGLVLVVGLVVGVVGVVGVVVGEVVVVGVVVGVEVIVVRVQSGKLPTFPSCTA